MCVCAHVYAYVNLYVNAYMCIFVCLCLYICMKYIHVYVSSCVFDFIHVQAHADSALQVMCYDATTCSVVFGKTFKRDVRRGNTPRQVTSVSMWRYVFFVLMLGVAVGMSLMRVCC